MAALGLLALWAAWHWLAQLQDINLAASHASHHAAFQATRMDPVQPGSHAVAMHDSLERSFTGGAHQWKTRHAEYVLDQTTPMTVDWSRHATLTDRAQPGSTSVAVPTLRRDWRLQDLGLVRARVQPRFTDTQRSGSRSRRDGDSVALGLALIDGDYLSLVRQISIAIGAGHASSDAATQQRVGASASAWSAAHAVSRGAGASVQMRATAVDAAWGRASLDYDWLNRWQGRVPQDLLQSYGGD